MSRALALLLLLLTGAVGLAGPEDAVVRIQSHGVSGTVVWSGPGRSLILTCAHGHQGPALAKPIKVEVPTRGDATPKRVPLRLLAYDYRDDLALIELGDGPLSSVLPVAPPGYRPSQVGRSIGYDEMRWPATDRPAHVLAGLTETRERPWHGRSGGALVDGGYLIGVCHGYTGPRNHVEVWPGAQGLYVSHDTILRFLARQGWVGCGQGQQLAQPQHLQRQLQLPLQRSAPQCPT